MEYLSRSNRNAEYQRQTDHWNEVHEDIRRVQKKSISINSPGDKDEAEADSVARNVVSGESAEIKGGSDSVQRMGDGSVEATPDFSSKLNSGTGGGNPLDDTTRSEMGSKMGADLSGVKIHTGNEAHAMSESINAKAFTYGQDIYFNQGYSPANKELLAHELTHTVQQSGGVKRKIQRSIKMELQTNNLLWAIKKIPTDGSAAANYVPDPQSLGRKFTPNSSVPQTGDKRIPVDDKSGQRYKYATPVETGGNTTTYIAKGSKGEKFQSAGSFEYVPAVGAEVTQEALLTPFTWETLNPKRKTVDVPHYTIRYQFKDPVTVDSLKDTIPDFSKLTQINKADNTGGVPDKKKVTVYSYKLIFSNNDGTHLELKIDESGKYKPGEGGLMAKKQETDIKFIDADKEAQVVKVFRFTQQIDPNTLQGKTEGAGGAGELQLISVTDNSKNADMEGMYNANTFRFIYQNYDKTELNFHLDQNNNFQPGLVKLLKVGKQTRTDIDFSKSPQYKQIWNVKLDGEAPEDAKNIIRYLPPGEKIDQKVSLTPMKDLWKDNAKNPDMAGKYIPGSYTQEFYLSTQFTDGKLNDNAQMLLVHLDEGRLKQGHYKLENVGQKIRSDIKTENPAEFVEIWKVSKKGGTVPFYDPVANKEILVKLDKVNDIVNTNLPNVNKGTYERRYYWEEDLLNGKNPMDDAMLLQVHVEDNQLQEGHDLFLDKKEITENKEQNAIELQSESGGYVEFETSEWFNDWPELEARIQEAYEMTKKIDKVKALTTSNPYEARILGCWKNSQTLRKLPFDTGHFNIKKGTNDTNTYFSDDNRDFYVMYNDATSLKNGASWPGKEWWATIQVSESLDLSQVGALIQEVNYGQVTPANMLDVSKTVFDAGLNAAKNANAIPKEPEESAYGHLKGFVDLIVYYIIQAQTTDITGHYSKAAFPVMARTDFHSMYMDILNDQEKTVFRDFLLPNNCILLLPSKLNDRINESFPTVRLNTLKSLQVDIKAKMAKEDVIKKYNMTEAQYVHWTTGSNLKNEISNLEKRVEGFSTVSLTGDSRLFYKGVARKSRLGPTIKEWLDSIVTPKAESRSKDTDPLKDELSYGPDYSDAMGQRTVSTTPGAKNYGQAQFEIRGSTAFTVNGVNGNDQPAKNWVDYAKLVFEAANKRSADTPNDPTTAIDESSNTVLKK